MFGPFVMTVALLTIGTELLRGEVASTNGQWLADQLTQLGFEIAAMETVADHHEKLVATLKRLLDTHSLVIATGGLGPTTDDLTTAAAAEVAGVELATNHDALATIRHRIEERGDELRPGHDKQALLPVGGELLPNTEGTAPGFILRTGGASVYCLPGVHREMQHMFEHQVVPRIRGAASNDGYTVCLHTFGPHESWLADRLESLKLEHPDVTVGYQATGSSIDLRIHARGPDYAQARDRVKRAVDEARTRLGDVIYGEGDQTMALLAGRAVRKRGWRLAIAESCTGGLISHQLTSQPASDYLVGGAVTYANSAKTSLLGVSEDTLRGHGAVSAEVAAELAEGARRVFDCEVGISATGIAGPTGAAPDKPIGLCHWAVAHPDGTELEQRVFSGTRSQVQHKAAHAVLALLRRTLAGNNL